MLVRSTPRSAASFRAIGDTRTRPDCSRTAAGAGDGGVGGRSRGHRRRAGHRGGRRATNWFGTSSADQGEHRADRHLLAGRDDGLIEDTVFKDLDFNRAFLRVDHRDNVAALDRVARMLQPFDQRAGLHVGAERRHSELRHDA